MQVGQLVSCIGGDLLYFQLLAHMPSVAPRLGLVYTLARIVPNCPSCKQDHVFLEELEGPFANGYPARWFRPIRPVDFDKFMERVLPPPNEARFEG